MDSELEQDEKSHGMTVADIYFVIFRRKRLILLSAASGVLAALILLFVVKPPKYQSQAKLLIKYVVENKSPVPHGEEETTKSLDGPNSLINTEVTILTSLDLGRDVAASMGPEKILAKAGGGTDLDKAAIVVVKGLEIEQIGMGSVLGVSFQHSDPEIAQGVLGKIILSYYKKHNEMHRPVEISNFLTKEIERLRGDLGRTEEELRAAKNKAKVFSPEAAQKANAEQIAKIRESLFETEAELAARQAALGEMTKFTTNGTGTTTIMAQIPRDRINEYKKICARLDFFSKREQELLTQFTETSTLVLEIRDRIAETEKLKSAMEDAYPSLAGLFIAGPKSFGQPTDTASDPTTKQMPIQSLKSKIEVLKAQLQQVESEAAKVDEATATIAEIQRKKELQENDLKYFMGNLETSRINAAMGGESAPNISVIESPTPPRKMWSKPFKKKVAMVAAAGLFGGLALAFFLELFLDRSVKRPVDIESRLRLPLLISIPDTNRNGRRKKQRQLQGAENSSLTVVGPTTPKDPGWYLNNSLNRFYTGLRDRLLVYFEVRNVTHKPKLVAVTSCHKGAGVTSIAAGLAASLSETGDGNVLLVDMNPEQQAVQKFSKGHLTGGLASALEPKTKQDALVQEKLYVVTERTDDARVSRFLPKRFSEQVAQLKASDYDYIIFDMPPVSPTSVTPRLAGLMDMVLLVIESEKTNQDVVKKVNALLAESKANVSTVLNKTHNYVPNQLHQEYLNDPE